MLEDDDERGLEMEFNGVFQTLARLLSFWRAMRWLDYAAYIMNT